MKTLVIVAAALFAVPAMAQNMDPTLQLQYEIQPYVSNTEELTVDQLATIKSIIESDLNEVDIRRRIEAVID